MHIFVFMTKEQAASLCKKYYPEGSIAYNYLYEHSHAVAEFALKIAENNPGLKVDAEFVETSALLHDIGIFMTDASKFGCYGKYPYLAHGYLGREILEKEGFPEHALVCERHVGVGISKEDIIKNKLPLPARDMLPLTTEEQIVCYADKFFTKKDGQLSIPKDPVKIMKKLAKYGPGKPAVFRDFMEKFGVPE
jgi:uncharacterized protein